MNTLFALFLLSFLLSLLLTPYVGKLATRFGIVDVPMLRKVHGRAIPRIGGVVIFFSFVLPFTGALFVYTDLLVEVLVNPLIMWLGLGGLIVFVLGLWDDIHRLPALVKLIIQVAAATVAYAGGLRIEGIFLPGDYVITFQYFSFIITILWFVLVVNAINLIDGLDGLAAGVVFFSSLILLGLSIFSGRVVVAMGFAALAGSTLGFLRYNFNPATIFMGDGGSYFLGYMLAGLSIMGSVKGQTTVALLIPIVAMGVPLFDTIVAPIRRFVRGRPMFQPDKGHLHHQLLRLGLNHRNTVLILYGATVLFGLAALVTVFIKDLRAAVILAVLAIGVFWIFRRMGYLEYLAADKIGGYFYDMGDLMGVTTHRRTFLDRQIEMEHAHDHDSLWQHAMSALELLKMDRAEMRINGRLWTMGVEVGSREGAAGGGNVNEVQGRFAAAGESHGVLAMRLPLVEKNGEKTYGTLYLEKDIVRDPLAPFTLRRIEHLRRSLVAALKRLEK